MALKRNDLELVQRSEVGLRERRFSRPVAHVDGHAHSGSFEGAVGGLPVYNVAVHVTGRDFYVFELEGHDVEVETRA